MSSSVDSQIVTMKFDNTQFQKGVSATMDAMSKLKTAITGLPGATKGLDAISNAASRFSLGNLKNQVGGVSAKFVALSTVAITALSNITNRAIDAGIQLAKSLTISPIMDGFREYELKMGSIQTILANTQRWGTSLKDVTKSLNELNRYADKTIYNFGDMTKNIGLFTNAGIKLEDATSMIKGFSNVAAASGTNAEGAAHAAYQLSQALSAGKIQLMDWKSLTNVGMGNKNMQEGLINIAQAMGKFEWAAMDQSEAQMDFNASLKKGWMTTDVMTSYLKIMAGEMSAAQMKTIGLSDAQIKLFLTQQKTAENAATKVRTFTQLISTLRESVGSSWATTFEILLGNFNQATKLFTSMNNTIGGMLSASGNARNKMLRQWSNLGGKADFFAGLEAGFHDLIRLIKPIHDAFRDVFPATTGKDLANWSKAFRNFMENLRPSKETMKNLHDTFQGLFAVLHIGWSILKGVIHYFTSLIRLVSGGSGGILALTGSVGQLLAKFDEWLTKGDYIKKFFDHVIAGRAALLKPIIGFVSDLLKAFADLVATGGDKFFQAIGTTAKIISPYLAQISDRVSSFVQTLKDGFGKIDLSGFKSAFQALIALGVDKFFQAIGVAADALGPILVYVIDKVLTFVETLQNGVQNLDFSGISRAGAALRDAFSNLGGSAAGKLGGLVSAFDIKDKTDSAVRGIDNVAGAMKPVAHMGDAVHSAWQSIADAFVAVGHFLAPVWDRITSMFGKLKDKFKEFFSGLGVEDGLAAVNTGFFIAFYMMFRKFLKSFSGLGGAAKEAMEKLGGSFDQLTANLKTMQNEVRANMIMKIAIAIGILAAAIWVLSNIKPVKLAMAIGAIGALMYMMMKVVGSLSTVTDSTEWKTIGKSGAQLTMISGALILIGAALLLFAGAVYLFGKMDVKTLMKGISSVGIVLGMMVGLATMLGKFGGGGQLMAAAAGIAILAFALTVLAGAIKLYSAIDYKTLLDGGLKVAATIGAIALVMGLMPPNVMASAAALFIVANALIVVAGAMKIFASMSISDMAKSLIMLGGSLVILTAAMMAAEGGLPGAAALLVMAAALGMLVPQLVILGNLSWGTILKGLAALAGIFVVLGLATLVLTPLVPVMLVLGAAIALVGVGLAAIGAGMFLFATGLAILAASGAAGAAVLTAAIISIAEIFPLLMQQIGLGMIALADVLSHAGPQLEAAFTTMLGAILASARKLIPQFGATLVVLIHTGLQVLRKTAPDWYQTGWDLLIGFLVAIRNNIYRIVTVAYDIAIRFMQAIGEKAPELMDAGAKLVIKFINGIADAIDNNVADLRNAGLHLAYAIVNGMTGGLLDWGVQKVKDAASELASHIPGPIRKMLGIESPSKVARAITQYVPEGMVLGLQDGHKDVSDAAEELGNHAVNGMKKSMAKAADAASTHIDSNPKITPVLDLTQLQNDASKIGGMFGSSTIKAGVSYKGASDISRAHEASLSEAKASAGSTVVRDVKLEQHNHSPKALSPVEIYRQTKNLISLEKEALKI